MGPKKKNPEGSPDDKKKKKKKTVTEKIFSDISQCSFEILVLAKALA